MTSFLSIVYMVVPWTLYHVQCILPVPKVSDRIHPTISGQCNVETLRLRRTGVKGSTGRDSTFLLCIPSHLDPRP